MVERKKSRKKKLKKTVRKKRGSSSKKEENTSSLISKKETKHENKILRNILISVGVIFILIASFYFYIQSQRTLNYKGVEFQKTKIGKLTFYETRTLANSSSGALFGFRLRTNPIELKKIPFEGLDKLRLMKLNGYTYSNNSFNCKGDGVIAMANLQRLFSKTGMKFIRDPNSTCDSQGRYNYFNLKYGNKTEIREVGNHCYDIFIKGDDQKCEILPVTEKLMVELYVKYLSIK